MVIAHQLEWTCASPLWGPATTADRVAMRRPTILSFANDAFIEELTATLATSPADLAARVAVYESARATPAPSSSSHSLKLYQPAHGRHYLVAANLVCQIPGIPDRVVDRARDEAIGFVLRRVDGHGAELGWVITRPGETPEGEWRPVPDPRASLTGEQLYPMFGLSYEDKGRRRKLNIGLLPVGSREQFEAAEIAATPPDTSSEGDPRANAADARLADALALLQTPQVPLGDGVPPAEQQQIRAAQEAQEREATAFLLLDLADWLAQEAPSFWTAISSIPPRRPSGPTAGQLYDALTQLAVDTSVAGTWLVAMRSATSERDKLFGDAPGAPTLTRNARRSPLFAEALRTMLHGLVGELGPAPVPPPAAPETGEGAPPPTTTGLRYIARAIFRRPRCGALHKDVVSDPSAEFVLAGFYDFDAPARPVRISLPIDTSIAGLRKFKKNVSFVLSKSLRAQLSRTTDLKKALDGNIASGKSFELGEICSFSIPVITICALIVLMIFIQLLNIVFWWLPFLKICLPIPQPRSPQ
jgi:hypothetical protein